MSFDRETPRIAPGCLPSSDDSQDPFYFDPVTDEHYGNAVHESQDLRSVGLLEVEPWQMIRARQRVGGNFDGALEAALIALDAQWTGEAKAPELIAQARERCAALLLEAQRDSPLSHDSTLAVIDTTAKRSADAEPPASGDLNVPPRSVRAKSSRAARRSRSLRPTLLALRSAGAWLPLGEYRP